MKKVLKQILAVVSSIALAITVMPIAEVNDLTVVYADEENSGIVAYGDDIFADLGQDIVLEPYVEDTDGNMVNIENGEYCVKWYKQYYDGVNGSQEIGEGVTYTISSVKWEDYTYDKNMYYEYIIYDLNGNELTKSEYRLVSYYQLDYEYSQKDAYIGDQVAFEANLMRFDPEQYEYVETDDSGCTYEWYKVDKDGIVSEKLGDAAQYTIDSVALDDFTDFYLNNVYYLCKVYRDNEQIISERYWIRNLDNAYHMHARTIEAEEGERVILQPVIYEGFDCLGNDVIANLDGSEFSFKWSRRVNEGNEEWKLEELGNDREYVIESVSEQDYYMNATYYCKVYKNGQYVETDCIDLEEKESEVDSNLFWNGYFGVDEGWMEGAAGYIETDEERSWTAQLDTAGWGGVSGAQIFKEDVVNTPVKSGDKYNISYNITATADKWIMVGVYDDSGLVWKKWTKLLAEQEQRIRESIILDKDATNLRLHFFIGGEYGDSPFQEKEGFYENLSERPVDIIKAWESVKISCKNISFVKEVKEEVTTAPIVTNNPEPVTTKRLEPTTNVKIGKAKIAKASKVKNSIKAKISLKKLKKVTGYQVQISVNKKFKKANTVSKFTKKVNLTIKSKKLKGKKKLYVRTRAYKIIKGRKVFGAWTKAKKIKIK